MKKYNISNNKFSMIYAIGFIEINYFHITAFARLLKPIITKHPKLIIKMSATLKTLISLFILGLFSCSYLPETKSEHPNLIIKETAEYIILSTISTDNSQSGIMFYPGGLVDPHAYIKPLEKFALEDNRTVLILKVASNLAILNSKKASTTTNKIANVDRWILGGHSLGGSTACIDIFNNQDAFEGLFLLASYSTKELADIQIPIISITASHDNVLDLGSLNENKVNLPEALMIDSPELLPNESTIGKTIYYNIEGGNHGQFGNYGAQKGDGDATITTDMQHLLVFDMLRKFLTINDL